MTVTIQQMDESERRTGSDGHPRQLGDLLNAAAAGDRHAFTEFYRATNHRVFGLAVRIVRSPSMAEEITQEVYLQAWSNADRYDGSRSAPMTWLMMLTHRRAVDLVRSEQASSDRDSAYGTADFRPGHDTVTEQVDTRFDHQSVRDHLGRLTALERESIALAFYGDRTYREVADLLGIPLPTVKSRIRCGLKHLEHGLRSDLNDWSNQLTN
ncbi:sigma-70 family RNA polymerase sigma factor [Nocardia bovistercoris]|uniref:Sigma-70 family RNA polymerase sigma factor n=1 Tax=Nocardia bovistercoris TaxID=2785916 RepID=A0A931IBD1_9NOCA|nr:sigma-70 family RNA polymerase sigma factor [Nocardia bovistercoris]MBH0777077.1 sigma-70 family RNA polymerase sigma factor [Nocardia bovistercoris]